MSQNQKTDYNQIKADKVAQVGKTTPTAQTTTTPPTKKKQVAQATVRKQSLFERLFIGMFGPERLKQVSHYVAHEVLGPAIKDMARSGLHTAVDMLIYRDGGSPRPQQGTWNQPSYARTPRYGQRVNYSNAYTNAKNAVTQAPVEHIHDVDFYIIPDRNQAIDVLNSMKNDIANYGQCSVADYKDYIGVDTTYIDQTVGWIDLTSARVVSTRGGFTIELPFADQL